MNLKKTVYVSNVPLQGPNQYINNNCVEMVLGPSQNTWCLNGFDFPVFGHGWGGMVQTWVFSAPHLCMHFVFVKASMNMFIGARL